MATPIMTKIVNQEIKTQVDLERFSEYVKDRVFRLLNRAQADILNALMDYDPTVQPATAWKRKRLERLNEQIDGILKARFGDIDELVNAELTELADFQQEHSVEGMKRVFGVNLFDVTLTRASLEAIVTNTMIDGALIGTWWNEKPEVYRQRFEKSFNKAMQRIELGLVKGESVGELIRAVRGTRTEPAILDAAKHEAAALIRTSVMQVAQTVRRALYDANADVLQGLQVVATLDARTTPLCRALDGTQYNLDGTPMNGGRPLPPGPPFHWNCRSTLIPIFKPYSELDGNGDLSRKKQDAIERMDKGTRASMNGQVPAKMNYEDWLKSQDEETQKEILGEARWELWRKGVIGMADMIHQNGRPLTIEELKRKISRG